MSAPLVVPDRFAPEDDRLLREALIHFYKDTAQDQDKRNRAYAMVQVLRQEDGNPQNDPLEATTGWIAWCDRRGMAGLSTHLALLSTIVKASAADSVEAAAGDWARADVQRGREAAQTGSLFSVLVPAFIAGAAWQKATSPPPGN